MKMRIWPNGQHQMIVGDDKIPEGLGDDYVIRETAYCEDCGRYIVPEHGEPFASCNCGTTEWYR